MKTFLFILFIISFILFMIAIFLEFDYNYPGFIMILTFLIYKDEQYT